MQSRRDQVQAHLFVMSRLASGMLRNEPDTLDKPVGRTFRTAFGGMVLAIVAGLVVALYGIIVPGGATSWQQPGTLVLVSGSGTRLLYVGGVLHPVLNLTSARLIAGDQFSVQSVDANSLTGVPRGAPVGIMGAPDTLPDPGALATGAWQACATTSTTRAGAGRPLLTLAIGADQAGRPVGTDGGVLVADSSGGQYLLWRGQRLSLDTADGAIGALGYELAQPVQVADAFLDTLPVGPDVTPPYVADRGAAGPELAGRPTRVGQLFTGADANHYLLRTDGLVGLTDLEFDLLRGDPRTQRVAYGGGTVTVAAVGPADLAAHLATTTPLTGSLPARPPVPVTVGPAEGVCAREQPVSGDVTVSLSLVAAAAIPGQPPVAQPGVTPSCRDADLVSVPPGSGALVSDLSAATAPTYYLVTDTGVKYPLPSSAAVTRLGYTVDAARPVPDSLLALLPSGPSLDPAVLADTGLAVEPVPRGGCTD